MYFVCVCAFFFPFNNPYALPPRTPAIVMYGPNARFIRGSRRLQVQQTASDGAFSMVRNWFGALGRSNATGQPIAPSAARAPPIVQSSTRVSPVIVQADSSSSSSVVPDHQAAASAPPRSSSLRMSADDKDSVRTRLAFGEAAADDASDDTALLASTTSADADANAKTSTQSSSLSSSSSSSSSRPPLSRVPSGVTPRKSGYFFPVPQVSPQKMRAQLLPKPVANSGLPETSNLSELGLQEGDTISLLGGVVLARDDLNCVGDPDPVVRATSPTDLKGSKGVCFELEHWRRGNEYFTCQQCHQVDICLPCVMHCHRFHNPVIQTTSDDKGNQEPPPDGPIRCCCGLQNRSEVTSGPGLSLDVRNSVASLSPSPDPDVFVQQSAPGVFVEDDLCPCLLRGRAQKNHTSSMKEAVAKQANANARLGVSIQELGLL
jgi:hypothetical protein